MRSRGASTGFYFVPPLVWTVIMLGLMLGSGSSFPGSQIEGTDLVVHFGIFGIWAFLIGQSFYKQAQWPVLKFHRGFFVLVLGGLLAAGTEAVQGFLLGSRYANLGDYVADVLGLLVGLMVFERLALSAKGNRR
ncbi:MAG: hypothetical protein FJ350_02540 [Sphingomonadales bacterium]|nr:hypothetical protein [Sphingomonadales bacterium]